MNHIIKVVLFATAGMLAVVSAYLTSNFMFTTGEPVGLGSVFAAAGVALDIIKTISPIAVLIAWKNGKQNIAIAGGILAITLTALSIQASYSSIDRSVTAMTTAATQSSQENRLLQSRIDSKRLALNSTLDQQSIYVKAGMATKAGELNERIDELNAGIDELGKQLSEQQTNVKPTLPTSAIAVISVAIEMASIIGLMLVDSVRTSQPQTTYAPDSTRAHATLQTTFATSETTSTTTTKSMTTSNYERVKEQVLSRGTNPSERAISKALDIPRYEAGQLLVRMEVDGLLVRNGRYRQITNNHND